VQVKGDLIPNADGRIMTRSRARASTFQSLFKLNPILFSTLAFAQEDDDLTPPPTDPDQYTIIPATLKILKVLIVELQSAAGASRELDATAAAELAEEGEEDDEWEDDPGPFVDLGTRLSKEQLMAYAAEDGPGINRQKDDETQGFLVDFFSRAALTPDFPEEFQLLTPEEQQRLHDSAR
jgi:importin-9